MELGKIFINSLTNVILILLDGAIFCDLPHYSPNQLERVLSEMTSGD